MDTRVGSKTANVKKSIHIYGDPNYHLDLIEKKGKNKAVTSVKLKN